LLDAAHIIPDNLPESKPTIDNGISLCKLHHAAYDSFILGVTPDYIIHVRRDVLEEEDGPVLQHGLQGLHKSMLILPSLKSRVPAETRWHGGGESSNVCAARKSRMVQSNPPIIKVVAPKRRPQL